MILDPEILKYSSAISYLVSKGRWIAFIKKGWSYIRRGILFSKIIKWTTIIVAIIETSAVYVFSVLVFLGLIPLFIVPYVIVMCINERKSHSDKIKLYDDIFKINSVTFIFARTEYLLLKTAKDTDSVPIVIRPISIKTIFLKPIEYKDGAYHISVGRYFVIRKKVIKENRIRVICIF